MIEEAELRSRVAAAARGEESFIDLRHWLDANDWNMHKDSAPVAVDLASAVRLLFYEFDDDLHSAAEVRSRLISLLSEFVEIPVLIIINAENVSRVQLPLSASAARQPVRQVWTLAQA